MLENIKLEKDVYKWNKSTKPNAVKVFLIIFN